MDTLTSFYASYSGDASWMVFALLAGAVVLGLIGINTIAGSRDVAVKHRLVGGSSLTGATRRRRSLRNEEAHTAAGRMLMGVEPYLAPTNEKERSSLRLMMVRAGYTGETAVRAYLVTRVALAVTLPVAFLLLAPSIQPGMSAAKTIGIAGVLCVAGLYVPFRWVQTKVESRQRALTEGFPDALDMLVVCVEAGLGMDAALVRVSEQIAKAQPLVAEQFALAALELRAGKPREEALRNLAERTGVEDISTFATLLIQSEALGTNLAQTLRVQADEMRTKRMLRAEEMAHKLPVKLTIPLIFFILPTLFAVVLGPAIIGIIRNLLPSLGGS